MKVITLAGFKWVRGKQCHVSSPESVAQLREALEGGKIVDKIKQFQFYPTIRKVADRMVEALFEGRDSSKGRVLEPSAGDGALLKALDRWRPGILSRTDAVEINPEHGDSLRRLGLNLLVCGDFLLQGDEGTGQYEHIIANPPFAGGRDIQHFLRMVPMLSPTGRLVCLLAESSIRKSRIGAAYSGETFTSTVSEPVVAGDTTQAKSVIVTVTNHSKS